MEKKTKLLVKAAVCDARKASESTLSAYEKITLDCAVLLANQESQKLFGQYGVEVKAAGVVNLEEDIKISSTNGRLDIRPGQAVPAEKTYLMVNGKLDIAPGSEEQLKSYVGMTVNGKIFCPESMASLLGNITLNGSIETYPDDAIRLKSTAVLDRTFRLRAKEGALYHARRVVALAPDIDFQALANQNVRFSARELIVAESLAEAAVPLFGEETDIEILPDGCALINDNAVLDEALVRRWGGKLYVRGNLFIPRTSVPLLEQITFLRVQDDLAVAKGMENAVYSLGAEYGRLLVVGGTLLRDRTHITVSRAMLEQAEDGLSVTDCVETVFDPDVSPALIRERLVSVTDCVRIICTGEQRPAVEAVAEDFVHIGSGEELPREDEPEHTSKISAALYVL